MKSTNGVLQKKQALSEANRERKLRWENFTQCLELNVQMRERRQSAPRMDTARATNLRPAAKITDPVRLVTCSRHFMIQNKTTRASTAVMSQNIVLPPIGGYKIAGISESINYAQLRNGGPTMPKDGNAHQLSADRSENTVFRILVAQRGASFPRSNKRSLISFTALNRPTIECYQDADRCSRLDCAKGTFGAQPTVASISAPLDQSVWRRDNAVHNPSANDSGVMTDGIKHDASLCETKQQRGFSSGDSAIETESQRSEDKHNSKTGRVSLCSDGEDYYTDQRIAEWVLTVNSNLFSTGDDISRSHVEEQDIATIKIIYDGD